MNEKKVSDPLAPPPTTDIPNRFADCWLGYLPVPLPKNYILGIDIQQKDFEHYGRPSYLRGQWQDHGWWYYYLYAAAIKVPLGLWCLGLITLLYSLSSVLRGEGRVRGSSTQSPILAPQSSFDTLVLLTPPLVIFCVVSSKTGFSEHFRYVLPCFPFLFIWLSQTAKLLANAQETPQRRST